MAIGNKHPREGDLFNVFRVGGYTFEIRYGHYTEAERDAANEPVPIYPDLDKSPLYNEDGFRITNCISEGCRHFTAKSPKCEELQCLYCIHYDTSVCLDIGICRCKKKRRRKLRKNDGNGGYEVFSKNSYENIIASEQGGSTE